MGNLATENSPVSEYTEYHDEVRNNIVKNSRFDAPFVLMNALATIVACEGLFANSTAVVIGAMIIAMLLGPITGIALSLVDSNSALLRRALVAEVGGVGVVLGVAFFLGKIHQELPLTPEILARTSPNILDLIIALAGGAAGAYATVSPRLSVGLVGVAIATALVPPLSVCAICMARGEVKLALGGFLLFFANFVAIQAASSLVMWIHGYHSITKNPTETRTRLTRVSISIALLLGITIALSYNFWQTLEKQRFQSHVREKLKAELSAFPGVFLADLRFDSSATEDIITVVLRTPTSFEPERVAEIEDKLPMYPGKRLELHIRSILTKETTRNGYLHISPQIEETPTFDRTE